MMVDCNGMDKLLEICISTLDEMALQKKTFSIDSNMPFTNKTMKKKSCMRNYYLKNRLDNNKRAYNKLRNHCVWFFLKKMLLCKLENTSLNSLTITYVISLMIS